MSVIWHKVWYDLWQNKLRTLLVVASIAVGVFAVGITFGMVEQMIPAMDGAHMATHPSHGTLYLNQPIDRDIANALQKIPGVLDIDLANTVQVRFKLNPEEKWHRGNILHREDYENQTYDILSLKAGAWPKGRAISVERMHGPYYGIDIGDQLVIEVGDQARKFTVTGKIRHPFVPPPNMYDVAWFFGGEDVMEMFGIPRGSFGEIKFSVHPYSADHAKRVASEIKERLAKQQIGVISTVYQDPVKHWGRNFIDGLSLVIRVLAALSMLLSIVLVLNTLTAIITQQTNQIGILKAIGGSSFTITRVYLMSVLIYGLLSLCIALPLGLAASFKVSQWFLGLYNIDHTDYQPSSRILLIQFFSALAVPLLAALIPVLNGAAITVRQAIASYGIGGDFGSNWIDRAVEVIGRRFLASYYALALSNTFRRKGRLLLTQLVLITAGIMFLMVMTLSRSIKATLDSEFGRRTHDVILYLEDLQRVDRTVGIAEMVAGVEKADMWLIAPATILHRGQKMLDAGLGSQLQGIPIEDPMYHPMIVEGRWFEAGDNRVVVLNKQTADDDQIQVGDRITLDLGEWGHEDWTVIGLYRTFLMFGGGFSTDAIYAPRQAVFEATKKFGKARTLIVRTESHSEEFVNRVSSQLEDRLKKNHIAIVQTETMPMLRKTSDTAFAYVIMMLLVLAVIVGVVGGIGLMGSLWISVIERTKEIGILRAIGATTGRIMGMFVLEGLIQGMMSWVFAVPLAMLVSPFLADAIGQTIFNSGLEYKFNLSAVFLWLAIVMTVSFLASAIPAHNAAQINIRQSLNYE